ncbi:MAG: hypothetical protein NTW29_09075 [Bacteroidetes bacterium]|nr:hypothetical protein [Bacteroidota bacterium]
MDFNSIINKLLIFVYSISVCGCNNSIDERQIFKTKYDVLKKIERPIKTKKRFVFEKENLNSLTPPFDSIYIKNMKRVFLSTSFNIAYVGDGDVLLGHKKSTCKLLYTSKSINDTIEFLNYTGSLRYLINNGKFKIKPYALSISQNWYYVCDIESI